MKIAAWLCALLIPVALVQEMGAQSSRTAHAKTGAFDLRHFDEPPGECRAKGRLQDRDYCRSATIDAILAKGKDAVPLLIAQITDETPVEPIYDFWNQMTVGDIAEAILDSLFTDADWKTSNMPNLESLKDPCNDSSDNCWHRFVKVHGRRFIQRQWLAAWNANKNRIYWDAGARCFRVSKDVKPTTVPHTQ